MKIRRYYQGIGYPSDMHEHDEYGDWVKWEDVKLILERNKELEKQNQVLEDNVIRLALALNEGEQNE